MAVFFQEIVPRINDVVAEAASISMNGIVMTVIGVIVLLGNIGIERAELADAYRLSLREIGKGANSKMGLNG